jgi:hypothetical protein
LSRIAVVHGGSFPGWQLFGMAIFWGCNWLGGQLAITQVAVI